jgi:hypothetical protein
MELIDQILDKLREWVDRAIDALLGSEPQRQPQAIPIPVEDRPRRR